MKTRVRTLQHLADLLGLSRATVSRALNDSPLIAEATRLRVKEAAAEGRFAPNVSARRLTRGRSRTVAFVTHRSPTGPALVDQLGYQLLEGVTRGLACRGYETLLKPVDYQDYSWVRSMVDSGQVDGFIVLASSRKADHIRHLVDEAVPFVTWGAASDHFGMPSVESDDRRGASWPAPSSGSDTAMRWGNSRVPGPKPRCFPRVNFPGRCSATAIAWRWGC